MDKKKALFHAVVTGIIVMLILAATISLVWGFMLLMEKLIASRGIWPALLIIALIVAIIVSVSSYRYFRKED
jgi:uncharacterized membrane protein